MKLGRRYADVVWTSGRLDIDDGKDELRMEMLWNGYRGDKHLPLATWNIFPL